MAMNFRKDRVRVVSIWPLPQISEQQLGNATQNFLKLPIVEKNLLKFDISFANGAFNETLQELGIQKPKLNCLVIIEAETYENINEIVRDPEFQKIFHGASQSGRLQTTDDSAFFAADFATLVDK